MQRVFLSRFLLIILLLVLLSSCSFQGEVTMETVTGPEPGEIPQNLEITEHNGSLDVYWEQIEGALYRVYFGTHSGFYNETNSPIPVAQNNVTITELTNGVRYYVAVTSIIESTESEFSNEASGVPSLEINPSLNVEPEALEINCLAGSSVNETFFLIENNGLGDLAFTTFDNATWAAVSPVAGSIEEGSSMPATVNADCTSLTVGNTYTANITVNAPGATNSPKYINFTVHVNEVEQPPEISLSKTQIDFTCTEGDTDILIDSFLVNNGGDGTLMWVGTEDSPWFYITPENGTAPTNVTLRVTCSGLTAGHYSDTLTISEDGGPDEDTLLVNLDVMEDSVPPDLALSPTVFNLGCVQGQAAPVEASLSVANLGGLPFNWTATDNRTWVGISPTSGNSAGSIDVTIDCSGLSAGNETATITVTETNVTDIEYAQINLTVTDTPPEPIVVLSPDSFSAVCDNTENLGAITPNLSIANGGTGTLNWAATDNQPWLNLSSTAGTAPSSVTLSVNCTGLEVGNHIATISVSEDGGPSEDQATVSILVTEPEPDPVVHLDQTSFNFNCTEGDSAQLMGDLAVTNTGGGTLQWDGSDDASWLAITPTSGTAPSDVDIYVDCSSLAPDEYTATITIEEAGLSTASATVNLTVDPIPMSITLSPDNFSLTCIAGENYGYVGTINISEDEGRSSGWSASDNRSWLTLSPSSGSSLPAAMNVYVDCTGVSAGVRTATITVIETEGAMDTATVTASVVEPVNATLYPETEGDSDDGYLWRVDDAMYNINLDEEYLNVRESGWDDERSFFQFDLGSIDPANVISATLYLHKRAYAQSINMTIGLYGSLLDYAPLSIEDWFLPEQPESTVIETRLFDSGGGSQSAEDWYIDSVDLLDYINSCEKPVFILKVESGQGATGFDSGENSNVNLRPRLEIEYMP